MTTAQLIQRGRGTRPVEAPATLPGVSSLEAQPGTRCQLRPATVAGKMRRGLVSSATSIEFGRASALACRECGPAYGSGPLHACEECFGPVEIAYDGELRGRVTRESIAAGP